MSNNDVLLHDCYSYGHSQTCRSNYCAWFEDSGGIFTMCLPDCRKYYNRKFSGQHFGTVHPSTLSFCERNCKEHSLCMSFTWDKNSTLCILHSINTHTQYSQDQVAGICYDSGIRPSTSPSESFPSLTPTTPAPTVVQLTQDPNMIRTSEIVDVQSEEGSYVIILSIILMIMLTIVGVVFYCLYQRNCVEKQLDRISSEFMKRDPKRRRFEKEEPEDDREYRKREIEAQAASFREYLDEQISEIKDQLETAKENTAQSTDRFERIKQQISERFVSLLADASDGFPSEARDEDTRALDQKRKHRLVHSKRKNHSKKRSLTKKERKIINIIPPSADESGHESNKRSPNIVFKGYVSDQGEADANDASENLDVIMTPKESHEEKLDLEMQKKPLSKLHVRHNASTGNNIHFNGLYDEREDVEESHSSDDLDVITPPTAISSYDHPDFTKSLGFDRPIDTHKESEFPSYMLNLQLME